MMFYLALLTLALLTVVGITLILLRKSQEAQREAFEALAARRGWSLQISNQSLGRPALLRLSSRGGAQWTAHMTGTTGQFALGQKPRMTEFTGDEPKWSEGYAFIGPVPPQSQITPMTPAQLQVWTRSNIIGDGMGADLSGLEPQAAPDSLTVLATTDPGRRMDLGDLAKVWKSWASFDPTGTDQPIVMLGPDGMRARLRYGARTADQMEQLIDFALTVTRTIGNR